MPHVEQGQFTEYYWGEFGSGKQHWERHDRRVRAMICPGQEKNTAFSNALAVFPETHYSLAELRRGRATVTGG
jgi:hypothetical protein